MWLIGCPWHLAIPTETQAASYSCAGTLRHLELHTTAFRAFELLAAGRLVSEPALPVQAY